MLSYFVGTAQKEKQADVKDSLYIREDKEMREPDKVLHAELLYIDLIRDLGARKGEKEWNVAIGLTDNNYYDRYTALMEYEWAPVNRLGFEVELPFSIYYAANDNGTAPKTKLNSLKHTTQYTFLVSDKQKTSMALGYIHEFELAEFGNYGKKRIYEGNVFNPFFVAAKRWGNNTHTPLYTGPVVQKHFGGKNYHTDRQINSNFHYMITGTRNFIGVELNKLVQKNDFDMDIRRQMRVGIAQIY